MSIKSLLIVFLTATICFSCFAQHQKIIDSLHVQLHNTQNDSARSHLHFALNNQWARFSLDSGLYHANKILKLAQKPGNDFLISLANNAKGKVYFYRDLDSAAVYFEKARDTAIQFGDSLGMADAMLKLSYVAMSQGNLNKALDHNQQSMAIYKRLDDKVNQAEAWYNVALIYRRTKQLDMAKRALSEAIQIYRSTNNILKNRNALINLSAICTELEQYDSAVVLSKEAHLMAKKLGYTSFPISLVALGETFQKMNLQDSAYKYYSEAISRVDENTPSAYKTYLYFGLASYYMSKDQLVEARPYLDQVKAIGTVENNIDMAISYYKMTSQYFHETGNFKQAYAEQRKHEEMKDEYYDQRLLERTTELEQIFEKEKNELEIATLTAQNEKQQQARKSLLIISILLGMITIAILFIFYQRNRQNKLKHQLLNEEIESLRLRISQIFSEVRLSEIETDLKKIQSAFHNDLTEREAEILQLAVTNKTNAEIADNVHLSVNTVKYHLKNIYSKIGVSSRLEARQAMKES